MLSVLYVEKSLSVPVIYLQMYLPVIIGNRSRHVPHPDEFYIHGSQVGSVELHPGVHACGFLSRTHTHIVSCPDFSLGHETTHTHNQVCNCINFALMNNATPLRCVGHYYSNQTLGYVGEAGVSEDEHPTTFSERFVTPTYIYLCGLRVVPV